MSFPAETDKYRLPTDVKPTHYDLTIVTDLEDLTFDGIVKISLDVVRETNKISLNTTELKLKTASIYSDVLKSGQLQTNESIDIDTVMERVTYIFPSVLPAGSKAELTVAFGGKLTGSMAGYYRSSWENEGKQEHYTVTQFEPTSARRAFPCWDEPLLKATFAVTLISRADTVNLSNMPAISEEIYTLETKASAANTDLADLFALLTTGNDKWKITKFQTTPLMSSYLVAYANGHFEYLETSVVMPLSGKTLPMRIYATADNIHQAQFALDVKVKVLPLYEKIFDVPYPLPKLDTLVVSDFDAGAMENWGLITGRTSIYLLDPKNPDLQTKKRVASVQSHEVAHMWFGNITTMEWWKYLYLNEGFATLMGEVIISAFPEFKVNSEFITTHLQRALNLDAKLSSHPIEMECPDAGMIGQIFDNLSYSKAASVLRMLSDYVGEELFLKGVSLYLKKKLYANSVTNDLWEGIAAATSKNIIRLMDSWISKMGFPVLTVTETSTGIRVRQDRFLETGPAEPKDNETIWNVPLNILSVDSNGKGIINRAAILEEREQLFELDTNKPFKLNAGTSGAYRVLYTPERVAKIAAEAAKPGGSIFSLNDRIGLVHDATALSKAGLAKMSSALTLLDGLKGETEYLVWSGIADSLSSLVSIWWEHPKLVDNLNEFRRTLFVPLVHKLGYDYTDADSTDTSLLRTCAITQAASAKDPGVVHELSIRFARFVETGDVSNIPADLLRITFAVAVKHGGRKEYDTVVKVHNNPPTPTAKLAAISAMSSTEDLELLKETFQFILDKTKDQDVIYFFRDLSMNTKSIRLLSQFFNGNYQVLYKRFEATFTLSHLVGMCFGNLSSENDYAEVENFFKDKDTSKYNLALAQALDSIRAKAALISRSSEDMAQWFEGKSK